MFDSLESRLHLHTANLNSDGVLTVTGGATDDRFEFRVEDGMLTLAAFESGIAESPEMFDVDDVEAILIYGNAGSDYIDLDNYSGPAAVDAGKGNDTLLGGLGRDTLKGGAAGDSISGGDGNDVVVGGFGADTMSGGKGRDLVDYAERNGPIVAGLGSNPDDGEPGENDIAQTTFEILRGGSGNDRLRTTVSSPVTLIGGAGDDTLTGGSGNDALDGGLGLDQMFGNGGNDTFYARDGIIERLEGGEGTDSIISKDKKDRLISIP